MLKRLIYIVFHLFLGVAALLLVFYLFFENEFRDFLGWNNSEDTVAEAQIIDNLTVVGDYNLKSFDIHSLDPADRFIANTVYEPLVRRDFDFSLKPALALSWGQLDSKTWLFKLRPGVKFTDGSVFSADSVVQNFQDLKSRGESDIAKLLINIDKIEKVSDLELKIAIKNVDPLFLLRISYFLQSNKAKLGTGSMKLASINSKEAVLILNDEYWGDRVNLKNVKVLSVADPYQRLALLEQNKADIVNDLPKSSISSVDREMYTNISVPKLEIGFLVFNGTTPNLKNKTESLKRILDLVVDKTALLKGVDEDLSPIYQFIPRGILGLSGDVKYEDIDIYEGKKIIRDTFGNSGQQLIIHYLSGMDYLAEDLQSSLSSLGLGILIQGLSWEDMQKSMQQGKADLYLLLWKFDMPDNSEFLRSQVLESSLYTNQNVKNMVSDAIKSEDFFDRSKKLQDIMKIIVGDEPLGFPIFEKNTNYFMRKGIKLRPNLDGGLNLQTVRIN